MAEQQGVPSSLGMLMAMLFQFFSPSKLALRHSDFEWRRISQLTEPCKFALNNLTTTSFVSPRRNKWDMKHKHNH